MIFNKDFGKMVTIYGKGRANISSNKALSRLQILIQKHLLISHYKNNFKIPGNLLENLEKSCENPVIFVSPEKWEETAIQLMY